MSSKRGKERQEFLVFILILYVVGFVFLYSNIVVAVVLLGLAIFLSMVAFPSFDKAVRKTVVWLVETAQRRATPTDKTEETTRETTTTSLHEQEKITRALGTQKPAMVEDIITTILNFKPFRRPNSERDVHTLLLQYLAQRYPSLRYELPYERTQIDAQIDKVGIEIKYQPKESDYDRLYGQIEKYLQHLDYIIAVIAYERSSESTEQFKKRIERANWHERVCVIPI